MGRKFLSLLKECKVANAFLETELTCSVQVRCSFEVRPKFFTVCEKGIIIPSRSTLGKEEELRDERIGLEAIRKHLDLDGFNFKPLSFDH